jgi:hypothetical protein
MAYFLMSSSRYPTAEEIVAGPASRLQGLPGLGPDDFDVLPANGTVGARGQGHRVDVVAGLPLVQQSAEAAELDVVGMGAHREDVHVRTVLPAVSSRKGFIKLPFRAAPMLRRLDGS